jgi:quercetin dioxygenase-like cupin family protein
MSKNITKTIVGALVLAAVAAGSYTAGAAKGKEAANVAANEMKWEPLAPGMPLQKVALWGDRDKGGDYAMLLKLPAGGEAGMHSHTGDYHAINLTGTWVHTNEGGSAHELPPGSYVMQPGKQFHNDACKGTVDCIIFVHQHAKGDFTPAKTAEKKAPEKK